MARERPTILEGSISTSAGSSIVYTEVDLSNVLVPSDMIVLGMNHDIGFSVADGRSVGSGGRGLCGGGGSGSDVRPMKRTHGGSGGSGAGRATYVVKEIYENRLVLDKPCARTLPYGTIIRKVGWYFVL